MEVNKERVRKGKSSKAPLSTSIFVVVRVYGQ